MWLEKRIWIYWFCLYIVFALALCKVDIYIDKQQAKDLTGMEFRVWIMQGNRVSGLAREPTMMDTFRTLPYHLTMINLTWRLTRTDSRRYWYRFEKVKSRAPKILYDPLLSIPSSGKIPVNATKFQLAVPCTGDRVGVAEFEIHLELGWFEGKGSHVQRIKIPETLDPVVFMKNCSKLDQLASLNEEGLQIDKICRNCRKDNYYSNCQSGEFCTCQRIKIMCQNRPRCKKPCRNGGVCRRKRCVCPARFYGRHCGRDRFIHTRPTNRPKVKPRCSLNCKYGRCMQGCKNNGNCKKKKQFCACPLGWYGRLCNRNVKFKLSAGPKNTKDREDRRAKRKEKRRNQL